MKTNRLFIALFFTCFGFFTSTVFAQTSLGIDSNQSKITWKGSKITGKEHTGEIKVKTGKFEINGTKLEGGSVEIDMTSMTCSDLKGKWATKLLNHLKGEDFFQTDKFPKASFVAKEVKYLDNGKVKVKGSLTIKNVTKDFEFDGSVSFDQGGMILEAKNVTIDRSLFYVDSDEILGKLANMGISDDFTLDLKLVTKTK